MITKYFKTNSAFFKFINKMEDKNKIFSVSYSRVGTIKVKYYAKI